MLYAINGIISLTTTQSLMQIPVKSSSKIISMRFWSLGNVKFMVSISDQNKSIDLAFPGNGEYRIYDAPNTAVIEVLHDNDARSSLYYELSDFNINIEDTINLNGIANGTDNFVFQIIAEYTEQPIDSKNTLVRDLAEAVTQVADGENLISAGEVFFQKRIRGLKQVGQGGFNN